MKVEATRMKYLRVLILVSFVVVLTFIGSSNAMAAQGSHAGGKLLASYDSAGADGTCDLK